MPRTKTSVTPKAGDVAAGDEVADPPRDCQLDHPPVLVYVFWYTAPLVPSTKTSRRPPPHDATAGPVLAATCPPIEVQWPQEPAHVIPIVDAAVTATDKDGHAPGIP